MLAESSLMLQTTQTPCGCKQASWKWLHSEAPKAAQHFHIQPNLTPAPVRLKVNPITKERLVKRILQRKDGPQPVDVANTISRGKGTSLRAAAKQARQEARRKARKAMYDGNYDQESKGPPPHTFRGPGGYQEFR